LATVYKILGQSEPADTSNADLYTVPADTETIVSTLVVSNSTAADAALRIFIREAGAAAVTGNAIAYDATIGANSQAAFTLGLTLSATDVITVRSSTANALAFSAFGSELN
jgi:hypothetical protein